MESARAPGLFDELKPPLAAAEVAVEADRCLRCGGPHAPAPCSVSCPAGIDVAGFVAALAREDPGEAASLIFAENLLGGTCARVCPVEALCEGACVLAGEDRRPVEIGLLQRYATDWALERELRFRRAAPPTGRHVAVVGAGPAGLVCAGELAALGHRVTVYEAREELGGLARYAIAPYRLEREPIPAEARAIAELGVELALGEEISSGERLRAVADGADAVFLGVGMGPDTAADYPGDGLRGVWDSLLFIEAIKEGRPAAVGDRVVVVGGGNTAIDVAREAVRLGAREVTVLYRRTEAEMPAFRHEVEEARAEGVRFEWLTIPVRFLGQATLEGVECRHMRLAEPDAGGRPRPVPVPGTEFTIRADTAVKAIGQEPRSELLSWLGGLELDRSSLRVDPESGQTANPKVFAAGDAVNGGGTVVEAVRTAKVAARGIDAYLRRERP
jgi:dihydropyrimidine dehydrogenase (NAD+) subunit PreT